MPSGVRWRHFEESLIMLAWPEDGIPEPHRIRDAVDEISGADHRDDDFSLLVATF